MSRSLLLLSYGAPEKPEDVVPYLHNLFGGKPVSEQRLNAAVKKYERYAATAGHYSPLNNECRKLAAGVREELRRLNSAVPIYEACLFCSPQLNETFEKMHKDGIDRTDVFITSAFTGLRYDELIAAVQNSVRLHRLPLPALPSNPAHKLFLKAQTDTLLTALANNTLESSGSRIVLFSAHSLPKNVPSTGNYVQLLTQVCRSIAGLCQEPFDWELVFQSASGSAENWLAPDIKDRLRQLADERKYASVVVSPLGFFCENMETEYDLDIEAGQLCRELGLDFYRAGTVGNSPDIYRMLASMITGK
ncbi:ferrochelatase [Planctomycetales bacterium]|nr:ferrochelatase [Planctomycetales bacterium]